MIVSFGHNNGVEIVELVCSVRFGCYFVGVIQQENTAARTCQGIVCVCDGGGVQTPYSGVKQDAMDGLSVLRGNDC